MCPANCGRRTALYLTQGGYQRRNPLANLPAPPKGYLWDFAKRANLSYRSYGEVAEWEEQGVKMAATVPGLDDHIHPTYPPFDLAIPDAKRIEIFAEEFKQFVAAGTVPRLSILRLPRDHTNG